MKKIVTKIILIILLVFACILLSFTKKTEWLFDKNTDSSEYMSVGEMINNTIVSQKFYCTGDGLFGVEIKFGTYERENTSRINYLIQDDDGSVVSKGYIDTSVLKNNEYYLIEFPEIQESKEKNYLLILFDDGAESGNSVTVYTAPNDDENGTLQINKESKITAVDNSVLAMKYLTKGFDLENFIIMLFFVAFMGLFTKLLYKFLR